MANGIATAALEAPRSARVRSTLADYWALTKPEVNFLIVIATCAGFYMAFGGTRGPENFPALLLAHTLLGTALVASGAGALNQYVERRFDALMRRTGNRPLPSGRLKPSAALWFGLALSVAGSFYLAAFVNPLASLLSIATLASYLFLYTPLKRKTPLCTLVGAVPGAMPTLIGWAAATGNLSGQAWILYAVLFLWQFPHFMAIAWIYRQDYARAGYLMLPEGLEGERFMAWSALAPAFALIPLTAVSLLAARAGAVLAVTGVILSVAFCYFSARLALDRSNSAARRVLAASIVYLPVVLILFALGK